MLYAFVFMMAICQGESVAIRRCEMIQVDQCMGPFQTFFDNGAISLKEANDSVLTQVCWKYEIVSSCVAPLMYYCPEIKQQLKNRIEEFEYVCSAHKSGKRILMKPTIDSSMTDEFINEAIEMEERRKITDSAIKASIAAAVTILLVLICVIADCISRLKIRRRVSKAMAASSAAQNEQLIQKQDIEDQGADYVKKV
jgi:hypothetical protein